MSEKSRSTRGVSGESGRVEIDESRSPPVIRLIGRLDARAIAPAWTWVDRADEKWTVDAKGVDGVDGAGLAFLWSLENDRHARVEGLGEEIRELLKSFHDFEIKPAVPPERESFVEGVGKSADGLFRDAASQIAFVGEATVAVASALVRPRTIRWTEVWSLVQTAGANALVVVGMISFLTGVIMAFQSAAPLRQFGVDLFVVNLVGLAVLRELGPIMTAVVLAGRTGSAFAAEIGTMKVNEEISALTTMGLDPVRFLVVPRILAGFVVTPLLTIYSDFLGILGGFLVMMAQGFPFATLWNQLVSVVTVSDVYTGIIKSFFFGVMVAGIGCLRGLQTGKGATAVGASTTSAVVTCIFLIVVVDSIFAAVFNAIGW
ncbi:MAG: MlaE family lipid ABC transporter permease subunit [Terrimicrobiaceae bacterium]|nr:MlaE family lipid ABC transporter permease subunit [Terrimicrobiaceae bacterium]